MRRHNRWTSNGTTTGGHMDLAWKIMSFQQWSICKPPRKWFHHAINPGARHFADRHCLTYLPQVIFTELNLQGTYVTLQVFHLSCSWQTIELWMSMISLWSASNKKIITNNFCMPNSAYVYHPYQELGPHLPLGEGPMLEQAELVYSCALERVSLAVHTTLCSFPSFLPEISDA